MSFPNNNSSTGMNMNFGYHLGNEESSNFETPYHPYLDSDAPIAGPSRSQDWYLNPSSEGYPDKSGYQESTLLDASGNYFVDPYATLHTEHAYGGFNVGKSLRCYFQLLRPTLRTVLGANVNGQLTHEWVRDVPAVYPCPEAGGLAAAPRLTFTPQTTAYPLATSSGPSTTLPPHSQPDNCKHSRHP